MSFGASWYYNRVEPILWPSRNSNVHCSHSIQKSQRHIYPVGSLMWRNQQFHEFYNVTFLAKDVLWFFFNMVLIYNVFSMFSWPSALFQNRAYWDSSSVLGYPKTKHPVFVTIDNVIWCSSSTTFSAQLTARACQLARWRGYKWICQKCGTTLEYMCQLFFATAAKNLHKKSHIF
jgi:hypothetical protein